MNERIAYVHIGTHKTGTSAFQRWLQSNRAHLEEINVHVPVTGSGHSGNYVSAAKSLVFNDEEVTEGWRKLKENFLTEIKTCGKDIIVSAEYLSGDEDGHDAGSFRVKKFDGVLKSIGFRTVYAVFFRNGFRSAVDFDQTLENKSLGARSCAAALIVRDNLERARINLDTRSRRALSDCLIEVSKTRSDIGYNGFRREEKNRLNRVVFRKNMALNGFLSDTEIDRLNVSRTIDLMTAPSKASEARIFQTQAVSEILREFSAKVRDNETMGHLVDQGVFRL